MHSQHEKTWLAEYAASAALQAEFPTGFKTYIAFKNAEAAGRVKLRNPGAEQDAAAGARSPAPMADALRAEYEAPTAAGTALRGEFLTFEAFAAWRRAEARGAVRVLKGTFGAQQPARAARSAGQAVPGTEPSGSQAPQVSHRAPATSAAGDEFAELTEADKTRFPRGLWSQVCERRRHRATVIAATGEDPWYPYAVTKAPASMSPD